MKNFRELRVWSKAHELALIMYPITQDFPKEEQYGLTSQVRRATLSIPTNIAEGCGRFSDLEFARFLSIAMGSASELEYLLLFARDLKILPQEKHDQVMNPLVEVKKMLFTLIKKIKPEREDPLV